MKRIFLLALFIPAALLIGSVVLAGDMKVCQDETWPSYQSDAISATPPAFAPTGDEDVYAGKVKVFLVEPFGRWDDSEGGMYYNAFLDFAIVADINLVDGGTWYETAEWDASTSPFDTIAVANIMAITAVTTNTSVTTDAWPDNGYLFAAHYADISAEVLCGAVGIGETMPGYTHRVFIEESSAVG